MNLGEPVQKTVGFWCYLQRIFSISYSHVETGFRCTEMV